MLFRTSGWRVRAVIRIVFALALAAILVLGGLPSRASARATLFLTGFPTLRQQHSLTCESSAASMATRAVLSESQIMAVMPRSPDPNLGFRGNPDGEERPGLADYGVYAAPVHTALAHFGYRSDVLTYVPDSTLRAYLNRGWPVVVWITYSLLKETPRLAAWRDQQFFLVPREHAVLAVGYQPSGIIVNDPWVAKTITYPWWSFNRAWGYFGDMALAIEPCPEPAPVTQLHVSSINASQVTWSWESARNAAQYQVRITRVDAGNALVWSGTVIGHSYRLSQPIAGATYAVSITSVSSCNSTATPARLVVQMAPPLSSPTPSPTPTATEAVVTPVPTGTVFPTPGATDTPGTSTPEATAQP
jgi:uncharacterized protein YvpB